MVLSKKCNNAYLQLEGLKNCRISKLEVPKFACPVLSFLNLLRIFPDFQLRLSTGLQPLELQASMVSNSKVRLRNISCLLSKEYSITFEVCFLVTKPLFPLFLFASVSTQTARTVKLKLGFYQRKKRQNSRQKSLNSINLFFFYQGFISTSKIDS